MRIVNLTPHAVVVRPAGLPERTYPPSGSIARLTEIDIPDLTVTVEDAPVVARGYGEPQGLPTDLTAGDVLIVSAMALPYLKQYLWGRNVLVVAPDTGAGAVRDAAGRILAVTGFVC